MNIKRFMFTGFAVFVTFTILDMMIHGIILSSAYIALSAIWRPDMNSLMWMMHLATLIFSYVFAWLFIRSYKGSGVKDALIFGLVMGIGMNTMASIGQYVMYPLPGGMCIKWFIYGTPGCIIAGIVAFMVYKEQVHSRVTICPSAACTFSLQDTLQY